MLAAPAGAHAALDPDQRHIPIGAPTLAPFGAVVYCMQNAPECTTRSEAATVTPFQMRLAHMVNGFVNMVMKPREDTGDVWRSSGDYGDCEDFALRKRKLLLQFGVPASAMKLALVRTPKGIPHAVLIVHSAQGDYVLDNLNEHVLHWRSANYRWLKIESPDDRRLWRRIAAL